MAKPHISGEGKVVRTGEKVKVLVAQSCLSLWHSMDYSPPGFSVHGILQARILECEKKKKNTGVGSHSLLQGIFWTQGSNLGLPHYRQILYHLSHQGSP